MGFVVPGIESRKKFISFLVFFSISIKIQENRQDYPELASKIPSRSSKGQVVPKVQDSLPKFISIPENIEI